MHNAFLKDFMNMRANLHKSESNIVGMSSAKKKETRKMPEPEGITFAYLVEKKPHQKEVIEYFKLRAEKLSEDQ
jgi:peroxiredoxin